jgi:formamidopyrimidine-DNA glycosylase
MPELPEVEVTRRGIAPHLLGRQVVSVRLGKPLRWPLSCDPQTLSGAQIVGLSRRGKYLLLELDRGWLLIHLGMSGSLQWHPAGDVMGAHDHFSLKTREGELRLHDPRRFGAVIFAQHLDDPLPAKLLGRLGVEPLLPIDDPVALVNAIKHRNTAIKQVLLAGDWVVGVGNIYASEALFHAGIRPTTPPSRLSKSRLLRLLGAISKVLGHAVELGGSTLQDFVHTDGLAGQFQEHTMVYGREAMPCRVCGQGIKRLVQGQRATYYCPRCQKP